MSLAEERFCAFGRARRFSKLFATGRLTVCDGANYIRTTGGDVVPDNHQRLPVFSFLTGHLATWPQSQAEDHVACDAVK
jgi:hypothetical protein